MNILLGLCWYNSLCIAFCIWLIFLENVGFIVPFPTKKSIFFIKDDWRLQSYTTQNCKASLNWLKIKDINAVRPYSQNDLAKAKLKSFSMKEIFTYLFVMVWQLPWSVVEIVSTKMPFWDSSLSWYWIGSLSSCSCWCSWVFTNYSSHHCQTSSQKE